VLPIARPASRTPTVVESLSPPPSALIRPPCLTEFLTKQRQRRRSPFRRMAGRSEPRLAIEPIRKTGDTALVPFRDGTVSGLIMRASWNAASLSLQFPGKLGEDAGTMPVLLSRRRDYRSVATDELVTLQPPE